MKCVNVRGKPFEGFEIQNQERLSYCYVSVLFLYFKPLLSTAQRCSAMLSAQPKYLTAAGASSSFENT